MIFGFILAIGVTLTQPYLALGAGQSFGRSGSVGVSGMHGQHPFRGFGFFGEDGLSDQGDQVIILQQSQPAPTAEPTEPAENRIYVQPRWVVAGMECRSYSQDTGAFRSKRQSIDPLARSPKIS